jgi:hypothetical protein
LKDKEVSTRTRKEAPKAEARQRRQAPRKGGVPSWVAVAALALVAMAAVLAAFYYLALPSMSNVPFTTFKSNFDAGKRVAVFVTYGNQSQFAAESSCYTEIIHNVALSRNASTIDFFILNSTTCTFSSTGLGKAVNISTVAPAQCLARAASEPSIFLNYSSQNGTVVKAYDLYEYGNAAYMAACPIAVDIS